MVVAPLALVASVPWLLSRDLSVEAPARLPHASVSAPGADPPLPLPTQLAVQTSEPMSPAHAGRTSVDALFVAAEAGSVTVDHVLDVAVGLVWGTEARGAGPEPSPVSLAATVTGDPSEECVLILERAAGISAEPSRLSVLLRVADDGLPERYSLLVPAGEHPGVLSIHRESASWNAASAEAADGAGGAVRWEDPVLMPGSLDDPRALLVAEALQRLRPNLHGIQSPDDSPTSAAGRPTWRTR